MVQSIQLPPDHPEFAAALNKRLAEISAELDQLRGTKVAAQTDAAGGSARSGSHKQRLSIAPSSLPIGTSFFETDRNVTYIVTGVSTNPNERRWTYLAGAMRGTISPDQKPAGLNNAGDTGFLFHATDYARTYRWTGTAWENNAGEIPQRAWCFFEENPGTGWSIADGTAATYSTPAGATAARTKPNLIGRYAKGAAAYTGASVAAVNPTLTGETADESGHHHNLTIPSHYTGIPTSGSGYAAGGVTAGNGTHTHQVAEMTIGTYPGSAHKHGIGTLAVTGGADPAHVDGIPYVRL